MGEFSSGAGLDGERLQTTDLECDAQILGAPVVEMVRASGADDIVCVESFGVELLAHAMTKPGLQQVLLELLHTRSEGCELYFDVISSSDRERWETFEECRRDYDQRYTGEERRIPIGLERQGSEGRIVVINPTDAIRPLRDGDAVIVVAKERLPVSKEVETEPA